MGEQERDEEAEARLEAFQARQRYRHFIRLLAEFRYRIEQRSHPRLLTVDPETGEEVECPRVSSTPSKK